MDDKALTVHSVLYAPDRMIIKENGDDMYLVLDPDTPNWLIVNAVGKDILTLCDGTRALKKIIEILCRKYSEVYDESLDHVLAFAAQAQKNQFLQESSFPPPKRVEKENAPLITLWINVTNTCNLRCVHCHLSSGVPFENEMALQEIFKVIDEARELGTRELVISGGEPLMRSDITPIIQYASQRIGTVTMVTNGTLITDELAEKLGNLQVTVQVSLDGARKETHESIRGKGTYEKTLGGVRALVAAGVYTRIAMTIMKRNIDEIYEIAELAKRVGVTMLHFPVLQSKGRAKGIQSKEQLEDEDYITIIRRMREIPKRMNVDVTTEEAFRAKIEKMSKIDLCGAGSSIMSIAADGNVYPCPGTHEEEFCAGNIREQSLRVIWKENKTLKKLRSLSVLDIEECRTCELKFICGGGCLVDKYHAYGRLDTPSARCSGEKALYWYIFSEKMREAAALK